MVVDFGFFLSPKVYPYSRLRFIAEKTEELSYRARALTAKMAATFDNIPGGGLLSIGAARAGVKKIRGILSSNVLKRRLNIHMAGRNIMFELKNLARII